MLPDHARFQKKNASMYLLLFKICSLPVITFFFLPNTTIDFPKYLFFCSQPFLSSSQLDKKRLTWQKNQSRGANLETKAVVHRKQFVHPNWQDLVYHFFVRDCQMTKIWEDGGMPKNDQKWWEMGSVKTWPITLRMVTTKIINSDRGGFSKFWRIKTFVDTKYMTEISTGMKISFKRAHLTSPDIYIFWGAPYPFNGGLWRLKKCLCFHSWKHSDLEVCDASKKKKCYCAVTIALFTYTKIISLGYKNL